MDQKDITSLSNEELKAAASKIKTSNIFDATIIGLLIGISLYSIISKGFGLLTFLPLLYLPIVKKNNVRNKRILDTLEERGLS